MRELGRRRCMVPVPDRKQDMTGAVRPAGCDSVLMVSICGNSADTLRPCESQLAPPARAKLIKRCKKIVALLRRDSVTRHLIPVQVRHSVNPKIGCQSCLACHHQKRSVSFETMLADCVDIHADSEFEAIVHMDQETLDEGKYPEAAWEAPMAAPECSQAQEMDEVLWPRSLYPDLYGEALDFEQLTRSFHAVPARDSRAATCGDAPVGSRTSAFAYLPPSSEVS